MSNNAKVQNEIDIKQFKTIGKLGSGSFGSVYKTETKKGDIFATKFLNCGNNEEQSEKMISYEIKVLSFIHHPAIIQYFGYSKANIYGENSIAVIMQFAEKGSLYNIIESIKKSQKPSEYNNTKKQIILAGIAKGMKYLHDRNIIHRDLKPKNILLNKYFHPLISDYGLSGHLSSQSIIGGTLAYAAPEILKHESFDNKVDVYSFGILMYEVLTDSDSYPKMNNYEFLRKVVHENLRPKFNERQQINGSLQQLMKDCWSDDPNLRPTFDEIFNKLSKSDKYLLNDVDNVEFQLYIKEITEITSPIEETLINKVKKVEQENQLKSEEFQKIIFNLKEENEKLKSRIQKEEDDKNKIVKELNSLSLKSDQQARTIKRYEQENQKLKAGNEKYRKDLIQSNSKNEQQQRKIKNLEDENKHLKRENEQYKKDLLKSNHEKDNKKDQQKNESQVAKPENIQNNKEGQQDKTEKIQNNKQNPQTKTESIQNNKDNQQTKTEKIQNNKENQQTKTEKIQNNKENQQTKTEKIQNNKDNQQQKTEKIQNNKENYQTRTENVQNNTENQQTKPVNSKSPERVSTPSRRPSRRNVRASIYNKNLSEKITVSEFNVLPLKSQLLISEKLSKSKNDESRTFFTKVNSLAVFIDKFKQLTTSCLEIKGHEEGEQLIKVKSGQCVQIAYNAIEMLYNCESFDISSMCGVLNEFDAISFELKYPSETFDSMYDFALKLWNSTIKKSSFNTGLYITSDIKIDPHFFKSKNVSYVRLDNSVNDRMSFKQCTSIVQVRIPLLPKLDKYNFSKCSSLSQITIPSTVTEIGNSAFSHCSSLLKITIPSSVTKIGSHAFFGCSSLAEISIPSSVIKYGKDIFKGVKKLNVIGDLKAITKSIFNGCSSLTEISIPSSVESISDRAFNECSSLKKISIPSSVTSIGWDAFNGCSSLENISIPPSVTKIELCTFKGCSSLKQISIPPSVIEIENRAFCYCSSLAKILIPSSVAKIGSGAFAVCSSLSQISIPSSVTSIGDGVFYECSSLAKISIPSSVVHIGREVFYKCSSLKEISIPSNMNINLDEFDSKIKVNRI